MNTKKAGCLAKQDVAGRYAQRVEYENMTSLSISSISIDANSRDHGSVSPYYGPSDGISMSSPSPSYSLPGVNQGTPASENGAGYDGIGSASSSGPHGGGGGAGPLFQPPYSAAQHYPDVALRGEGMQPVYLDFYLVNMGAILKTAISLYNISQDFPYEYIPEIAGKKGSYHKFPYSWDKHIINEGAWAQRLKDGADWYELPGTVNGTEGVYQIGINSNNVIFHRCFEEIVPFH